MVSEVIEEGIVSVKPEIMMELFGSNTALKTAVLDNSDSRIFITNSFTLSFFDRLLMIVYSNATTISNELSNTALSLGETEGFRLGPPTFMLR